MSDRIKILIQKRTSVKSQITNLCDILDKGRIDNVTLRLRIARLTELYHAFEECNDELAVLDPNEGHQIEFTNIQERFYSLAERVENILSTERTAEASGGRSSVETRVDNAEITTLVKKRKN